MSFTLPTTYWSQADAFIKYIGQKEGGVDKLKGKKIGLVYIDIACGKEPIATLDKLSQKYGFTFTKYPVSAPGIEQSATWLQIRQQKPDWLLMWGWGVMNSTAIKGAASIGYPMDHYIGVWWSGSEPDVVPAGDAAAGYESGTFHGAGQDFGAVQHTLKYVYDKNAASDQRPTPLSGSGVCWCCRSCRTGSGSIPPYDEARASPAFNHSFQQNSRKRSFTQTRSDRKV